MVTLATHEWPRGVPAVTTRTSPFAALVHGAAGWCRKWWRADR